MGRNIITGIPRIMPPRGLNENRMWKKFKGEKRDFTKLDRDNFIIRKRRVIHYGINKIKIAGIEKQENRRKAEFCIQNFRALVSEKVNGAGIKHLIG